MGAIDGTSHEIYRPSTESKHYFYSGHRKYQAINLQVIVDTYRNIWCIECGFMGHLKYAQLKLMWHIGTDSAFPEECILMADKIYPNRHPIVTTSTAAHLRQRNDRRLTQCCKLNRYIQRYWVCVEHAIGELKVNRSVGTLKRLM